MQEQCKTHEEILNRLNRRLRTLYQCNSMFFQAESEQELLQSICEILVAGGELRLTWIGYCEDDAEKTIRPVAQAGYGLDYLERVKISWGEETEAGQGPFGIAVRTGKACWVDDIRTDPRFSPWRVAALARGYASCIAIPLMAYGKPRGKVDLRGTLNLYSTECNAFDESAVEHYTGLATSLTYAVTALRCRLAEDLTYGVTTLRASDERKRAEEALREQASLLNLTHDTVFVRDMNDIITYWNGGAEELYGWTREEAVAKVSHQLTQTIFPAPLEEIKAELLRTGRWEGELIHTKRDGTQVVVASRWALQRGESGNPVAVLETNNDITERKRAEEALRRSEAYLERVAELSRHM